VALWRRHRNQQSNLNSIREAVFRYQVQSSSDPQLVSFLEIEDTTLSPEAREKAAQSFCRRLQGLKATLRVASPRFYSMGPYLNISIRSSLKQ
jgi:hypothetical protein